MSTEAALYFAWCLVIAYVVPLRPWFRVTFAGDEPHQFRRGERYPLEVLYAIVGWSMAAAVILVGAGLRQGWRGLQRWHWRRRARLADAEYQRAYTTPSLYDPIVAVLDEGWSCFEWRGYYFRNRDGQHEFVLASASYPRPWRPLIEYPGPRLDAKARSTFASLPMTPVAVAWQE